MDFHGEKLYSPKHNKKRLNQDQVRLLEKSFIANRKLEPALKLHLSEQLGVPPKQVAIWYQNKRARWKSRSLELDFSTLQVKLENALSEKRRLEKEVKYLQEELRKAQEMMFAMNNQRDNHHQYHQHHHPPNFVSCNSTRSSEEGGSSASFYEDNVHDHEVFQIDELYARFIGAGKSTWS